MDNQKVANILLKIAKSLMAEDDSNTISKGTVFEVVMKRGNWWTEMRKGVKLQAEEDGAFGKPLKLKETGFSLGSGFTLVPTKEGDKIKMVSPKMNRELVVRILK